MKTWMISEYHKAPYGDLIATWPSIMRRKVNTWFHRSIALQGAEIERLYSICQPILPDGPGLEWAAHGYTHLLYAQSTPFKGAANQTFVIDEGFIDWIKDRHAAYLAREEADYSQSFGQLPRSARLAGEEQ